MKIKMNPSKFNYITLLFLTLLIWSCKTENIKDWKVTVSTNLDQIKKAYLYKIDLNREKILIDSTTVNDNSFVLSGKNDSDKLQAYYIDYDKSQKGGVEFLVANTDQLNIAIKEQYKSVYSGTAVADDFTAYHRFKQAEIDNIIAFSSIYSNKDATEKELQAKILEYKEKVEKTKENKISFLKTIKSPELSSYLILNEIQTSSVIEKDLFDKFSNILTKEASLTESGKAVKDILKHFAAYKLNLNGGLLDYKSVKNKYDQLTEDNKNSKWGKVIQANLKKLELLGIGQAPPLLIAKKINGDNFNLSSITNKVILLDFWASWCGPCRMENPHYKKLNNKYKNKGLTIIGYSYDTKKDNWKKAIEKDGIDWINISNLKKQKDDVVSKSYQTSALPANIIIMDGKIVARNLFGYELDNFLMKHL